MRTKTTRTAMRTRAVASLGVAGTAALVIACVPNPGPGTTTTTTEAPTTTTTEAPTTTTESTTTTSTTTTTIPAEDEVSTVSVAGSPVVLAAPTGVAVGPDGTLYVAEYNGTSVYAVTPGAGGSVTPIATGLNKPSGLDVDGDGNVFVADQYNRRIVKVDADGNQSVFAGSGLAGTADGTGTEASFTTLVSLELASDGTIFAADLDAGQIRQISPAGEVTTLVSSSLGIRPTDVTATTTTVFATDQDGQRIVAVDRATGAVATLAGSLYWPGSTDGIGTDARFTSPTGIELGPDGLLYVAELGNRRIRVIDPATAEVTTLTGTGAAASIDGPRSTASFDGPYGLTVHAGSLFVAEFTSGLLRKVQLP